MTSLLIILCCGVGVFFVSVSSFVPSKKVFRPNANFANAENWSPTNRIPCQNDKNIFEDRSYGAICISDNATLPNMTLQDSLRLYKELFSNGEFIFGDDVVITMTEKPKNIPILEKAGNKQSCQLQQRRKGKGAAENLKFIGDTRRHFHDPRNWDTLVEQYTPLLHAEMIPSQFDTAIFVGSATYSVLIETATATRHLLVADMNFTTLSFEEYLATDEGSLQFDGEVEYFEMIESEDFEPLIDIRRQDCKDRTGCVNINFAETTLRTICGHVQCEEIPNCSRPQKPKGHCCPICAAVLQFNATKNFNFLDFTQDYWEVYRKDKEVYCLSSQKVSGSGYQVVVAPIKWELVDMADFVNYVSNIAKQLKNTRGVKSHTLTIQISKASSQMREVFLAVLAVLCFLLFGLTSAAYMVYFCRYGRFRFLWLRLQPRVFFWRGSSEDELRMEMTSHMLSDSDELAFLHGDAQSEADEHGQRPLSARSKQSTLCEETSSLTESMLGFSNPSYLDLCEKDQVQYISMELKQELNEQQPLMSSSRMSKPRKSIDRFGSAPQPTTSRSTAAMTFENPVYNFDDNNL